MAGGLPTTVADLRSNRAEHVLHAVETIGRSPMKLAVFEAVYYHKKRVKTVSEIESMTTLPRIRILQIGNELVKQQLFGQTVKDGETAYVQDPSYQALKKQILSAIHHPAKRDTIPTKRAPRVTVTVRQSRPRAPKAPIYLAVDDIGSFSRVRGKSPVAPQSKPMMSEEQFKEAIKLVIGEVGTFKDWGGEQSDLFTTGLTVDGKRRRAAFALKGPAKKGILRPKDMGKNGDQIQRLFKSTADVFLVQYHGQIHESVIEEMEVRARLLAADRNSRIWYGVIDGTDSNRLVAAYPKQFASAVSGKKKSKPRRRK